MDKAIRYRSDSKTNSRPRILLTADTLGGVWTFALDLAREIGACGGETRLATMGRPLDRAQWQAVRRIPGCSVEESGFRLEWMEEPWEDVDAAGEWLLSLERRWQPDLIHCNTLVHAALPWSRPVVMTAHSCVFSWFRAVKGTEPPRRTWQEYFRRVCAALESADRVVTPSAAMRDALAVYPTTPSHVEVIANGRPPEVFKRPLRKRHRILGAGRLWDEGKNAALLAAAAPRLRWPCFLAGDNGRACEQRSSLTMLGRLPPKALARQFSAAAVFAHPAFYEPFGLAPLEAGLSGCALVLGDIPSLREIWGEENALFVAPDDLDGFVDALQWLTAQPERWQTLGERAYRRASRFPAATMGKRYLELYRDTLTLAQHEALTA